MARKLVFRRPRRDPSPPARSQDLPPVEQVTERPARKRDSPPAPGESPVTENEVQGFPVFGLDPESTSPEVTDIRKYIQRRSRESVHDYLDLTRGPA